MIKFKLGLNELWLIEPRLTGPRLMPRANFTFKECLWFLIIAECTKLVIVNTFQRPNSYFSSF